MKIYPDTTKPAEEEVRHGHVMLFADVECEECGKVQSYASSSSRGSCRKSPTMWLGQTRRFPCSVS